MKDSFAIIKNNKNKKPYNPELLLSIYLKTIIQKDTFTHFHCRHIYSSQGMGPFKYSSTDEWTRSNTYIQCDFTQPLKEMKLITCRDGCGLSVCHTE